MRNTCRTCGSVRTGLPADDAAGVAVGGADPPGDAVVVVEHRQAHRRRRVGAGDLDVEQVLVVVERPARQPDQRALVERVELRRGHHVAGLGGAVADLRRDARAEQLRQHDDRGQTGGGAGAHPQPQGAPLAFSQAVLLGGRRPVGHDEAEHGEPREGQWHPAGRRAVGADEVQRAAEQHRRRRVGQQDAVVAHAELGGGETGEPGQDHRQQDRVRLRLDRDQREQQPGDAVAQRLPQRREAAVDPGRGGGDAHREQDDRRPGRDAQRCRAPAGQAAGGDADADGAGGGARHQLRQQRRRGRSGRARARP